MWRASSAERGLPKTRLSRETTVSAAITMAGPTARAATSSALASARRWTRSLGDSPEKGVSSTAEDMMMKEKPASWRISARREEAEARINFMSDDDRFLIFAEDASERVGDFTYGGVGFDGGEDGGEEVFGGGGAALEYGQGGSRSGGIASGAKGVQAGDLGALDFWLNA